jgi:hypothetical protein
MGKSLKQHENHFARNILLHDQFKSQIFFFFINFILNIILNFFLSKLRYLKIY